MPGFTVRQLCVVRQGCELLHGIHMDARPGELHVLLGPNGAGKSTLLRAMAGDWPHSSGTLLLDERPLSATSALQQARRRAVLPQQDGLSFGLCVRDLIALGRFAARDQTLATTRAVVDAVMTATQVSALSERRYPTLSGGEQRRVQLARVLAQVWDVPAAALLLDEPTHSLDPAHQHALLALLRTLAEKGFAILTSLHDLNLAAAYAQRISLMCQGCIVASGEPQQLLNETLLQAVYGDSLQFTAVVQGGRQQWLTRAA